MWLILLVITMGQIFWVWNPTPLISKLIVNYDFNIQYTIATLIYFSKKLRKDVPRWLGREQTTIYKGVETFS